MDSIVLIIDLLGFKLESRETGMIYVVVFNKVPVRKGRGIN